MIKLPLQQKCSLALHFFLMTWKNLNKFTKKFVEITRCYMLKVNVLREEWIQFYDIFIGEWTTAKF